jgi:hypothetical protein
MATKAKRKKGRAKLAKGKSMTKKITRGPNKGDTVQFKGSPSGKPFPSRVIKDVGGNSTLRDNGIPIGKKKAKKKK